MIIPIDRYFAEMQLSEDEKKRREDMANDLFILFQLFFWEAQAEYLNNGTVDTEYYKDMLYRQYCDKVEVYIILVAALLKNGQYIIDFETSESQIEDLKDESGISDSRNEDKDVKTSGRVLETGVIPDTLKEDIKKRVDNIVDTTIDNITTDFFTSDDRATMLAENESNYVGNDSSYSIATYEGYRRKVWITMADDKVRITHAIVDGVILDINEYYKVGQAEMLYPMDMSKNGYDHPEETVNCRCQIQYLK